MNGRRSNIEVIADILRIGEASKTHIMYSVGMSYAQLQKYLDYLMERGFLVRSLENSDRYRGGTYRISQEGKQLLQWIEKIEELLTVGNGVEQSENIGESLILSTSKSGGKKADQPHQPSNTVPV